MGSRVLAASVVFLSALLGLFALEVATRLIDHVPLFRAENFVARELDTVHTNGLAEYDPSTGWRQIANMKVPGIGYTTGEYGIRMPTEEIQPIPSEGILVVGDSFAVGSEVTNNQTWPSQLERMTGQPVINAAVGGYALDQTVLRAEELVPKLHPKSLLIELTAGFSLLTKLSVYTGAPKPYFTIEHGTLVRHNDPVPRDLSSAHDIGRLRSVLGYSYLMQFTMTRLNALQWWVGGANGATREVYSNEEATKVTCLLLDRLIALSNRNRLPVRIVVEYGALEALDTPQPWYAKHLDQCVTARGLPLFDAYETLHSFAAEKGLDAYQHLWVMHNNNHAYGHMSEAGNRLIASQIAGAFFAGVTSEK